VSGWVRRIWGLAVPVVAAALLVGCGSQSTRSDDATGSLGEQVPSSPSDVYVALAGQYYARGQMDIALQRANQALGKDANNANAHLVNALIYQRLGETAKAESHYRRAVELNGKDPTIRNAWGAYLCGERRYPEADEQFQQALANPLYPSPWTALTNAGICAKASGDSAKARGYFRQALQRNPNFGPALLATAELDMSQGDARSASTMLNQYFKTSPPTAQALELGVRVEHQLGNKKAAASYSAMLKQRFPGSPEAKTR